MVYGFALGDEPAADGVRFGYPELKHSIVPALVMTGLVHNLGRKAAFELISPSFAMMVGALTGQGVAPSLFAVMTNLGPDRVAARLKRAGV